MEKAAEDTLRLYPKAIAHLRAEIADNRFGLVFGAGVSKPLGFPSWTDLVNRIASDPDVNGTNVVTGKDLHDASKAQMLFQHFRTKWIEKHGQAVTAKEERKIQGQWRRIIHKSLYRDAPRTAKEIREKHPYLKNFIEPITNSKMTINYNFDDVIQQLLILRDTEEKKHQRSFETVWNAALSYRKGQTVIYHPNGFLPNNLLEFPSNSLVFSEDSFADQLIESMAGHYSSLLHHLSKTTCLLIGLSLQDATLKHLLRQSAIMNPGHFHYYVHFIDDASKRDREAEDALCQANFHVYNLITLFLDNESLSALGELLSMEDTSFRREAQSFGVCLKYSYYITGSIGAGKTTCISYMGSFYTHEEWVEVRPENLAKSWKELTEIESAELDAWIIKQFVLKNFNLLEMKTGIHLIDRAPIDPLGFTKSELRSKKAKTIAESLSQGEPKPEIGPGHLIFLVGEPTDMEARVISRHKHSDAKVIGEIQDTLTEILKPYPHTPINTFNMSIPQVVKAVAKVVLFEDYRPIDLAKCLEEIHSGGERAEA